VDVLAGIVIAAVSLFAAQAVVARTGRASAPVAASKIPQPVTSK
jgi:hypothetical protein